MANNEADSGLELVLDNRKLIIAFVLLIAFCGCFFVVGFIEGKRQGFQEGNQAAAETAPKVVADSVPAPAEKPAGEEDLSAAAPEPDQPLDWYQNISRREDEPASASSQAASEPVVKKPAPETAAAADKPKAQSGSKEPVTFSVQVGAYENRETCESKAQTLRAKGFDSRVEPPSGPGKYYLLKVGKFRTRPEADALQNRLKRQGFPSFIKAN